MLYDIRVHLPQVMERMLEDFHAGDVTKLESNKAVIVKLLSENGGFCKKLLVVDDEYQKRKADVMGRLEKVEKSRLGLVEELEGVERGYWETILGEFTRVVQSMPKSESEEQF
jgi:hypothetical protein